MEKTDDDPAPPPRRGRPRDPERSRRILEAACNHFYAHGMERASVDAIAAEAGVSKMTIYSNFGSKEGLFEAVIQERTDRVMGDSAEIDALDPMKPGEVLLALGEQFLALTREEHTLGKFRSVYGAASAHPEACRAFYRQGPERLNGKLATYLQRANEAGTLQVKNPRLAADLFLAMFLGDGHMRGLLMLEMPDAEQGKALLHEAVRVFLASYEAPADAQQIAPPGGRPTAD
ncbi:MAG: hypothetical protein RLZZ555_96 [Pseudomonadota bacterium]|jgi:TetR/AcrR family transcriptional repressor of mexJK operon